MTQTPANPPWSNYYQAQSGDPPDRCCWLPATALVQPPIYKRLIWVAVGASKELLRPFARAVFTEIEEDGPAVTDPEPLALC